MSQPEHCVPAILGNVASARQVVAMLNGAISLRQVYRLVETGRLRSTRELGKVLIFLDSLKEALQPAAPAEVPQKQRAETAAKQPVGKRRARLPQPW